MSPDTLAEMAAMLFEESGDALFLFHPESEELLDVNPMAQRLTGFTRPELLRLPIDYLFRAELQGGLYRLRQAYRKTGPFHSQEGFLLRCRAEGLWVPVNLTVTRLHAESRTLAMITARDMSEHRDAQLRLRQKEAELRDVLASVSDCLWSADVATEGEVRVRYCSPVAERLTGRPAEFFLRGLHSWVEATVPEDRPIVQTMLAALRSGKLGRQEVEHRLDVGADGTRWVRSSLVALRQPGGLRLTGVVSDITEAVHRREQVQRSEARYRSLLENLEQNVFLKDDQLRFIAANRRFCEGTGRTEADLLGKTDFDFYPPELAEKYRADDLRVLAGARVEVEEQNVLDGQLRWVRVIKTPVCDSEGRTVGVLGIFWDVTEQRALETQLRQAARMEAVGQLAGGIAHDFNNLLTAILGNLSLARSQLPFGPGTARLHDPLIAAESATRRAAEVTRQLLGFSRRNHLRPEPVDANRTLGEVLTLLGPSIDPRVELRIARHDDLWPVWADAGQLCQVVLNLALNARDAVQALLDGDQPGKRWVCLEASNATLAATDLAGRPQARPGEFVRLRISDNGTGIPAEVLPRIFEPFFTTKGPDQGTGLGLAMSFGIVQQHDGWLECRSQLGVGTTFEVYLPRCTIEAPREDAPTAVAPSRGGETILLVDDEPMLLNLGEAVLKKHGYEVLVANDGREAVERYRAAKRPIHLVVLDRTMPQMTGREALRELRRLDPEVAVLFASGYAADHLTDEERGHTRGFLSKPYSPQDLVDAVRAALVPAEPPRA